MCAFFTVLIIIGVFTFFMGFQIEDDTEKLILLIGGPFLVFAGIIGLANHEHDKPEVPAKTPIVKVEGYKFKVGETVKFVGEVFVLAKIHKIKERKYYYTYWYPNDKSKESVSKSQNKSEMEYSYNHYSPTPLKDKVKELEKRVEFLENKDKYQAICNEYGNFIAEKLTINNEYSCERPARKEELSQDEIGAVMVYPLDQINKELPIMRKVKNVQ